MPATLAHLRSERPLDQVPARYLERLPNKWIAPGQVGLTQATMAAMLEVSEGHYGGFERSGGGTSSELVADLVEILGATAAQRRAIYRWAHITPPEWPHELPATVDPGLTDRLADLLHYPALWVSRATWDVLSVNEAAAAHLPMFQPMTNLAEVILGPDQVAREMLCDWPEWARPMVEMLRMAVAAPEVTLRLRDVVASVRQHPPTRAIWDSGNTMREHPDGVVLSALIPTMSRTPLDIEIVTLRPDRRPDLRLVLVRPVYVDALADPVGPARSIRTAQDLADSVLEATGATVVAVNYRLSDLNPRVLRSTDADLEVYLRRAAVATAAGYVLPKGYLIPGDRIPGFPSTSEAITHHLRGGNIICNSREEMKAAIGNREDLERQLIPGETIDKVAHVPLLDPSDANGLPLGSVEAFQIRGAPAFTQSSMNHMERLATVRGAALARETAAIRIPQPSRTAQSG